MRGQLLNDGWMKVSCLEFKERKLVSVKKMSFLSIDIFSSKQDSYTNSILFLIKHPFLR